MNYFSFKFIFLGIALLCIYPGVNTATENATDKTIKFNIEEALRDDPRIVSPPIKVFVSDGIVSLSGSMRYLAEKEYAVLVTKKIDGVSGVIDQIVIKPTHSSDEEIRGNVLREFRLSSLLAEENPIPSVKDGIVIISGTLPTLAKKHEAQFLATQLVGVKEVQNEIRVKPAIEAPDSEIQKDVQAAIERDQYLFQAPIEVRVMNGEVTLSGEVGNSFLRDIAKEIVLQASSVKKVKNEITIHLNQDEDRTGIRPPLSDKYVKERILAQLRYDSRISNADRVEVLVNSGQVKLMGKVSNGYERKIVESNVRNVIGVVEIANLVHVDSSEVSPKISIDEIESVLQSNSLLAGYPIEVLLKNGVVTLRGKVNNPFDKVLASEIVRRLRGVESVNNDIQINERKLFINKVLEIRIKKRLSANSFTKNSVERIRVKVKNGKAILRGDVDYQSERREAEKVAYFIEGISAVINRLKIRSYDYDLENYQPMFPDNGPNPYIQTYEWYFFPGRL